MAAGRSEKVFLLISLTMYRIYQVYFSGGKTLKVKNSKIFIAAQTQIYLVGHHPDDFGWPRFGMALDLWGLEWTYWS